VELLSTKANGAEAKKWISKALVQIGQRANTSSFEKIFLDPVNAHKKMNWIDGPIKKPPAKAQGPASKATGGRGGARPAQRSAPGFDQS
jgi:hypothetical protein